MTNPQTASEQKKEKAIKEAIEGCLYRENNYLLEANGLLRQARNLEAMAGDCRRQVMAFEEALKP